MAKRDYYDILGVSKSASADEIKKAHRKLVRQYHPDVNKNDAKATERFKEVQEAYDVLSDAEKRKQYDQFGHAGPRMGPPPGAGDPFEAFRQAGGGNGRGWRTSQGQGVSPEDFAGFGAGGGGAGDFSSIFEQMFGGGAQRNSRGGTRRAQPAEQPKGEDLEHSVQLTFEQAALGTTLPLRMQIGDSVETIEVKVPPGIGDGQKFRVKGKGHPGPGGPGDLYITAKVAPHPLYRRDPPTGLDVFTDVPVTIYDALLGGKVTVPTLEGEVTLTLPPGTSSGAKLRIKGRGIKRGNDTGDAYAVIKILIPKDLSDDAKALVEKLKAAAPVKT